MIDYTIIETVQHAKKDLPTKSQGLNQSMMMEKKIPSGLRDYVKEIESKGIDLNQTQQSILKQTLKDKKYEKLDPIAKATHTNNFTKTMKNNLKKEWSEKTGQEWPQHQTINKKTGKLEPTDYQAHHIIPHTQLPR